MEWIDRDASALVRELAAQRPVLLVTGARQTGKTSLLQHLFPKHHYVSLDLPITAAEADESGEDFLNRHPAPLILDEVQFAPRLLHHVKARVDADRKASGQYLITGSQNFSVMAGVTETLAGRVSLLHLHSLSLNELERGTGLKAEGPQLLDWMLAGGYPEIHTRALTPARFYGDYVATYLQRDVRQVLEVRNLRDFERFLRLLALRSGQQLVLNTFASELGINPATVKSWLSVLEASQIVYLLQPYFRNLGKRLVKTPKVYFMDTGLLCFLAGIQSTTALAQSSMLGHIFETLALGQYIRSRHNRGLDANIYFYRDHAGHEVDFVVPEGEALHLIECKWAEQPNLVQPGFTELEKIMKPKHILSKTIITQGRTRRRFRSQGVTLSSCVDIEKALETPTAKSVAGES
ncbi:ATP-binding protein [soil metagenome]